MKEDKKIIDFTVDMEEEGSRLDLYLASQLGTSSRSKIQKFIKEGLVLVNGKKEKSSYLIKEEDQVQLELVEDLETEIRPEKIHLDIVYEDEDVIVINKPKAMVVHPAPGNYSGTLVNALLYHFGGQLSTINGEQRPGIVHRIDKDTTGLLVVAKNDMAHKSLAEQFKAHTTTREYKMIVLGNPKEDSYWVDGPIGRNPKDRLKMAVVEGGKPARTHFEVIERFEGYSLLAARLETGRTHQIRVHSTYKGYPLLGDSLYYGGKFKIKSIGPVLHAGSLGFVHPRRGDYLEFESDLPEYFLKIIEGLRNS